LDKRGRDADALSRIIQRGPVIAASWAANRDKKTRAGNQDPREIMAEGLTPNKDSQLEAIFIT
jgi:hypothetical protein